MKWLRNTLKLFFSHLDQFQDFIEKKETKAIV